ncbi:MAG: NADH-quinone oxidoreductase subunit J family protein [Planctomycetota bacterium]|jgi:NADH-quinone oxidoreductase subunit J
MSSILAALGLYLVLRPGRGAVRLFGVVVGLAAIGTMIGRLPLLLDGDLAERPNLFFYAFSSIAIIAAVRMISHPRPVYSALYFILVVLSSAVLFLLLHAEFMAFSLIIVYAGAILITYLFVLMLAQQKPSENDEGGDAEYDVIPREPMPAALVGFVMLALLSTMLEGAGGLSAPQRGNAGWADLERMPEAFEQAIMAVEPDFNWPPVKGADGAMIAMSDTGAGLVRGRIGDSPTDRTIELPVEAMPDNVQRIGLALVADFPVSLELAGVILLLAMFGAVVLARKQIDLGEDDVREAAGMQRLGFDDDPHPAGGEA